MTKKYKTYYIMCTLLSWLLVLGPLIGYVIYAFSIGEPHQKATLGMTVLAAALLTVISIVFKMHIRSIVFILIIGIYICIDKILPLIIIVSICTILDEFVITPLRKVYHNKYIINKEIDKRG